MKTKYTLILGSLLFIAVTTSAQDKRAGKPKVQSTETKQATPPATTPPAADAAKAAEAEQQAWMAYMTPGPIHKMLEAASGSWNEEVTFWMTPGGEATKATSTCTNQMILGGRYQESIHNGKMMGMAFEGKGLVGYDNIRKVLQSTWVDNMGTGVMTMEGKYDDKTKTATLSGKMVDPMSGKTENAREVIKFIDNDKQIMEMYVTKNGKEFKNMEITYTRQK